MEVKVEIVIELSDSTKSFITSLFAGKAPVAVEVKEPAIKQPEEIAAAPRPANMHAQPPVIKTAASAAPRVEPPVVPPSKPVVAKTDAEAKPVAKPGVSLEQLRKDFSNKVTDHREAIRAELFKLGATSISTLDPSKYDAMHAFILGLV